MPDRIIIRDLFLRTIIGIEDRERTNRQDVVINLCLETDTRRPGASDNINDAVNYRTLTKAVIGLVEESRFFLVEKLAEEIAALCLHCRNVQGVEVSVEKPAAVQFSKSVGVVIQRSNRRKADDGSRLPPEEIHS